MLAVLLFLASGCVCVSCGWFASAIDDSVDGEVVQMRNGAAFGANSTTDGCLREGHRRSSQCSDLALACITASQDFLRACLYAVTEPDTSVCDGAPAVPAFLVSDTYSAAVCQHFGWDPLGGASGDVVSELERYCAVVR